MKVYFLNLIKKEYFLTVGILLIFILLLLNFAVTLPDEHWAPSSLVRSDGATFLLTALAPQRGLGVPYKDYWEYRPPGFYLMLDFWTSVFGTRIISFKILEALTHFLVGLEIIFILRKIFSPFQAFLLSALTNIVFFSPAFGFLLYPEPYAIFFSLLGLICLLNIKELGWRFFLAALFFSVAVQLKDTFIGGSVALLPSLIILLASRWKLFLKGVLTALTGFTLPFVISMIYLIKLHALNTYIEVLRYKSGLFHINIFDPILQERYFKYFWESKKNLTVFGDQRLAYLFIFLAFILMLQWKNAFFLSLSKKGYNLILKFRYRVSSAQILKSGWVILLLYSLGSWFGPALEYSFAPHYVTSIIIPTYFFWGTIALLLSEKLQVIFQCLPKNVVFLPAVLIFLYPAPWVMTKYQDLPSDIFGQAYKNIMIDKGRIEVEKYLQSKTNVSGCILSVYGWKSSDAYLYAERRPCTRFIIPNIVQAPWQKREYRQAIADNPPQAIFYSIGSADMDYRRFEQEVLDIPRITKNCYRLDNKYNRTYVSGENELELYFPIFSDEKLRNCVKENIHEAN